MLSSVFCLNYSSFTTKRLYRSDGNLSAVPSKDYARHAMKWALGWALLYLLSLAPDANAQIRSGTITGLVTDTSGAVITDAQVTVTNTATHAAYSTTTTTTGLYTVPYLETGLYSVKITKATFETATVEGLSLNPSEIARADVALRIGAASAVVEVHASTEQLQTESSSISGAIDALVVDSIPNVTENPFYYTTLQNGVVPRQETSTSQTIGSMGIGVAGRAEYSSIGVNGGRAFENDIQLDGLPIMGDGFNEATIIPNEEGIQEVRVISNNFTADYGHGQSVMAITTRSGTNSFHGQVNYLNRNAALDANTWGNKQEGIPRPPFKVNNMGGAISGPIKKGSIFFFSSYHYLTFNQGQTYLETVPTALESVGNFTQTMQQGANGQPSPAQLFNPYQATLIAPNVYQRAPITPAIITPGLLPEGPAANTAALLMYSYYPAPNRTPSDVYNNNNYESSVVNTVRRQNQNNRIDYKRGRNSIYGSGGFDIGNIAEPFYFNKAPASTSFNNAPTTISDSNPYGQAGDTIILGPTLVVDLRYGLTRTHAIDFGGLPSGFTQYDAFGIAQSTQSLFAKPGAAPIVNPNFGGSGGGSNWAALSGGQFANKEEHQLNHSMNGSFTKLHGNWTYKGGVEYRVILANYTDFEEGSSNINGCCANDPGGNYTFQYVTSTGGSTALDNSPLVDGIGGAAMLLGRGVWFVRPGANLKPAYAAKYFAVYTQNDWRVKPRLTLNLGLRWDLQPGPTERYNRMAGIDLTKMNPFGTKGVLSFPGTNGYSRNMWDTEYHDFQPRVGAAYQVTHSLVARGGFGITYLPSNTGYFSSPNDYGEASFTSGNEALPFGQNPSGIPVSEFTDPAPIVQAVGANLLAPQNYGVGEAYFDRHLKNQIVRQANVFLEKSFGANGEWLVSAGWSDAVSNHLTTRAQTFEDLQDIPTAMLSLWKSQYLANNGTADPSQASVPNPFQPTSGGLLPFQGSLANSTIQQFIPLLPYPMMYGSTLNGSTGFGDYNSFQASLKHQFSSGIHLGLDYTWSKELDFVTTGIEDGQGVNAGGSIGTPDLFNRENNKNYGLADIPNRFVGTVVYESPFGSKGRFALDNRVARDLAGGWTLGSVVLAQGGMPVVLNMSADGSITSRIDRNPSEPLLLPKALQHWYSGGETVTLPCGTTVTPSDYTFLKYNLCAFKGETLTAPNGNIIPNIYWTGNSPQTNGNIRLPRQTNVDFSVRRSLPIGEIVKFELAAEISNLFNHPEFNSSPNGGLGNMNLTDSASTGLIPGIGSNSNYGDRGNGTFDPRQIVLHGKIIF